jgi:hypothetical protein
MTTTPTLYLLYIQRHRLCGLQPGKDLVRLDVSFSTYMYMVTTARLIYHLNMELCFCIKPVVFSFCIFTGVMWPPQPRKSRFFSLSLQQYIPVICGTLLQIPPLDAVLPIQTQIYQLHIEFYHLLIVNSCVEMSRVGVILFLSLKNK